MATGHRAFDGKTRTSIVAAIISGEPRPMAELQPMTPRAFEHVVRKCLAKDPEDRWQSAADIAEELRWIAEERPADATARRASWPLISIAVVVALAIGALIGAWSVAHRAERAPLRYTEITAPEGTAIVYDTATAVLSPNGQEIAMVAKSEGASPLIWVRSLSSPAARRAERHGETRRFHSGLRTRNRSVSLPTVNSSASTQTQGRRKRSPMHRVDAAVRGTRTM